MLLLTLSVFRTFSSVFIVEFEQVNTGIHEPYEISYFCLFLAVSNVASYNDLYYKSSAQASLFRLIYFIPLCSSHTPSGV